MFKKAFFISLGGLFFVIMLTNNIFPGILCQKLTRKFSFQILRKIFGDTLWKYWNFFFSIFDLNHEGYTLRKNSRFATMLKIHFYNQERLLLYLEYQQIICIFRHVIPKKKLGNFPNFFVTSWANPFEKRRVLLPC